MTPEDDYWRRRSEFRRLQNGGAFSGFDWVVVTSDMLKQQPATARPPSKDWTKIETYWPHLAKNKASGAVAPRKEV